TAELRESEALANVINETSIDSMIIVDKDGFILRVNPAVEKMFLYKEQAILGQSIDVLFASCEASKSYIRNNLTTMDFIENLKEVTATKIDGISFPAEIQIGKRFVRNKHFIACTICDITKKKQDQELITHMAYHDSLTNLPNKRLFNDQLSSKLHTAKQKHQTLAMMYLDLDRFKYIKDRKSTRLNS